MKPFLKYFGKGIWMPADKSDIKPADITLRVNAPKKRSKKQSVDQEAIFHELKQAIAKNGYKSIKLSGLLKRFAFQRKTAQRINMMNTLLAEHGLYALPSLSVEMNSDANIQIYNYPVHQLSELFETEKELEDFVFQSKAYVQLGINSVIRQYSPLGTKDKMDFKGADDGNDNIVLELKNRGGGKSAVEQVLRYAGQLRKENPLHPVRTILVTGIRNYATFLAICGMNDTQRESFEWYLYKFDREMGKIEFIRVNVEEFGGQEPGVFKE